MSEPVTEQHSVTRRLTDTALVIVAIAAIASWVWRRVRHSEGDRSSTITDAQALDDKIGGAVGFPPNSEAD